MDNSFLNLTTEENINKIKIDEELIPPFKKIMRNFQEYFNYMGYTNTRDYKEFFDKYILSKYPISNMKFVVNDKPYLRNATGLYDYEKSRITIDKSLLDNPTDVVDTFTHEFIHFLVMHNVRKKQLKNTSIDDQYLNEPLTEMLKMKILPLSYQSYKSSILIIKFWLLLNDKELDFNWFLNEGKFYDFDYEFKELFNLYWEMHDETEHILDAIKNKYFLNMQRYLINSIDIFKINTLEEYELLISKLSKRPSEDIYFMNKYYKKIEYRLCNILNINNKYRNKYLTYLKKYRELIEILSNDDNFRFKDTFYYYDCKYQIDDRRNVYINSELDIKGDALEFEDDNMNRFRLELQKDKYWNVFLSNKKLPISKTRSRYKYNKRKELINKHKDYIKSILYLIKFINDNEIIEDNEFILTK